MSWTKHSRPEVMLVRGFLSKELEYFLECLHCHQLLLEPRETACAHDLQSIKNKVRCGRKCKQIALLIASNFVSRSLYWLEIQFLNSLFFNLFTFAINLWHRKFVTADVTVVCINNQNGIQWWRQNFDKTFIWNHYEERLTILNTKNIKICRWTTKLEAIKI